jgi:hypothetical protein
LRFPIVRPQPIHIQQGTQIEYRLRLFGVLLSLSSAQVVHQDGRHYADNHEKDTQNGVR